MNSTGYGSSQWILLPYSGAHGLQYAIRDGRKLDLKEFLDYAEASRVPPQALDHHPEPPEDGFQDALTEAIQAAAQEQDSLEEWTEYLSPSDIWDPDFDIGEGLRNKAAYGATLDLGRDPKVGPHPELIEQLIRARLYYRFVVSPDDPEHPFTDQELRQTIQSALRRLEREEAQEPEDDDPLSILVSAAELARDPDLLKPPEEVLPWIAWAFRITLLAAREKFGKSWLAAFLVAMASRNGTYILWLQEEFLGDVVKRWEDFGADMEHIDHLERPFGSWEEFHATLEAAKPDVLVVDTLSTLVETASDEVPETSQGEKWQAIFNVHLRRVADHGTAVVVLHHATKATGEYRGSTGIGAGADMILHMDKDMEEANARILDPVGRFQVPKRRVLWTGSEYKEIPLEDDFGTTLRRRIMAFVEENPGCGAKAIDQALDRWSNGQIHPARNALEAMGAIENRGSKSNHKWHTTGKFDRDLNPKTVDADIF